MDRISGGKVLKRGTRHVVNRASTAYDKRRGPCHGASAWAQISPTAFARGTPKPITAMTHLLARLIYLALKCGHEYVDKRREYYQTKYREQELQWVAKQAALLNMQLVAITRVVGKVSGFGGTDALSPRIIKIHLGPSKPL